MNSSKDLRTLLVNLFKPPQKDPCDQPTNNRNSDTYEKNDENVIVVNDEKSNSNNSTFMTPTSMVNIVRSCIIDSLVTKGFGE